MIKSDVRLFLELYKIGSYLGITPLDFGKRDRLRSKIAPPLIFSIFFVASAYSFRQRPTDPNVTCAIINKLKFFTEILFVWACVLKNLKSWQTFYVTLKKLERKMGKTSFQVEGKFLVFLSVVVTVHLSFLLVNLFKSYLEVTNGTSIKTLLAYLNTRCAVYYQMYSVILICWLLNIMKRRYTYLNKYLHNVMNSKWILTEADESIYSTLDHIRDIYSIMHDLSEEFNAIFGWRIFFTLQYSALQILNIENLGILRFLTKSIDSGNTYTYMYDVMDLIAYFGIASFLVLSCDAMLKSAKKITTTCYILLKGMSPSPLKEELFYLAVYTKELSPKLTAAGFYEMNQTVLSAMFSTVTTYLIICIQFNMTIGTNNNRTM